MGIFDDMAARYDTPERIHLANVIVDALRAHLKDSAEKRAMDYGSGTGLVGLPLAECFQSLLLVDASLEMTRQVQAKIEQTGCRNATALCADFSNGVPPGLCADVVFMALVLLHIPDTLGILRELYTLLSPGGRLLLVDFNKEESIVTDKVHNGFVQEDLMQLARDIGFTDVSSHTFYHGKNIFMNRDASMFLLTAKKPE